MKNGKTLLVLGALATIGGFVACSDDDGDDAAALCIQTCEKTVECRPEAAPFGANCKDACKQPQNVNTTCTNKTDVLAKVKMCLAGACSTFESCITQVPPCTSPGTGGRGGLPGTGGTFSLPGTGGTGGTPGTGGSPGTGGTSGSADCAVCTKADACCLALQATQGGTAPSACDLKMTCDGQTNNPQGLSTIVQACNAVLSIGSASGLQACK